MSSQVSTFAQAQQIITRFKSVQASMGDLQKQISTGTKSDTYAGYGLDAKRLQQSSFSIQIYETYMNNIDLTQNDIKFMQTSLSETEQQLNNVMNAINIQMAKPTQDYDLATIKSIANAALEIVQSNVNQEIDGRYLFSGAQSQTKPYENENAATSSAQNLVADWLDGTLTATQFTDAIAALTDTQLGFNISIATAGKVVARADDNFEIDYTVKANTDGFKDGISALNILSSISVPDPDKSPSPDVPTNDQFFDVMENVFGLLKAASNDLRAQQKFLASASSAIGQLRAQHETDRNTMVKVKENIESIDVAEAVVYFQNYQTQLEASFRSTSIMSQLSLSNFIST